MPQQKDDLEAVRLVADALEGFEAKDQERIIRWAREKLGLAVVSAGSSFSTTVTASSSWVWHTTNDTERPQNLCCGEEAEE